MAQSHLAKGFEQPDDTLDKHFWPLVVGSVGVVYGDIGTSPLYAFHEAIIAAKASSFAGREAVFGVLSLILWALLLIVTLKYVIILLRADNHGEGGTFALMALGQSVAKRSAPVLLGLGIAGASFFYGDAVITPAISVLSAVEGLKLVSPAFADIVLPLSAVILICLFAAAIARDGGSGCPVRAGYGRLVCRNHGWRPRPRGCESRRARLRQSLVWHPLPRKPRSCRAHRSRSRLPGGHGRGGALCRSRSLRPQADPDRLVRARTALADHQLLRPGRTSPCASRGDREPVLSALSGVGARSHGASSRRSRPSSPARR